MKKAPRIASLALIAIAAILGVGLAQEGEETVGTVTAATGTTLTVQAPDQTTHTFQLGDAVLPAGIEEGDMVLVRTSADRTEVQEILHIEEAVEVVTEAEPDVERAVVGTVRSTGTSQLLVDTTNGAQAFVIDPERLFPPLPTADQKVIVAYRVEDVNPPLYKATELIVLPADFQLAQGGQVRVSSEPIAAAAAEVEAPVGMETQIAELPPQAEPEYAPPAMTEPAPLPAAPAPEPIAPAAMAELPATASPLALLLLGGSAALGLGAALRRRR